MLTEILIKPFIEDLEHQGIEDTTPYEQGFMAGMAALSSILSEHVDNKAQLFVYLGMAISEGMQWVENQVMERDNIAPIFAEPRESQPTPSSAEKEIVSTEVYTLEEFRNMIEEPNPNEGWDYVPTHDDLPASLIRKYAKKDVFFAFVGDMDKERKGKTILDLSSNRLQVIDMSGDQVKRPYYIKLR